MNLIKILSITLFLAFISFEVDAQVNYYSDISPIIYNQCSVCHRPGEIGPFALTNYDEVKNWASSIKYTTAIGYMPPWQADPNYSKLQGENYLTQEQIDLIGQWVDDGAIEGNKSDEALYPEFPEGSALGTPDLVLEMTEAHIHKGNNDDEYRYFVLPTGLTEDKMVKALEMRPGNSQIVHHALFFEDTKGAARARDEATPEYGFEGFGGFETDSEAEILGRKQYPGYVPGQKALFYPEGLGQTLSAGSDLVVQVHYAPWSTDEADQSAFNIFFADESEQVDREVQGHIMVPTPDVVNDIFFIPANQVKSFHGIWEVPEDMSILGMSPHMHLLGQDWTIWLETPDGETHNMISVPKWDFNWQGDYFFEKFLIAPKGSKVHGIASYDNTAENPNNPTSPPKFVTWGEKTTDEMYYLPIIYVPYEDGDEDVVFVGGTVATDDTNIKLPANRIAPLTPNPVKGLVNVPFTIDQGKVINAHIYDAEGQLVKQVKSGEFFPIGQNVLHFDADGLTAGSYFIHITGRELNMSQKFVKQ